MGTVGDAVQNETAGMFAVTLLRLFEHRISAKEEATGACGSAGRKSNARGGIMLATGAIRVVIVFVSLVMIAVGAGWYRYDMNRLLPNLLGEVVGYLAVILAI